MGIDRISLGGNVTTLDEVGEFALASFDKIDSDIKNIKECYIKLGFHLNEMREQLYYVHLGYLDFYQCVEKNFHLDKSAVSRCINVWEQFADQGKMEVSRAYKGYSYSQLVEMLPLKKEQRKKVTVDMSVAQIRAYKKSLKVPKEKLEEETVATSQSQKEEVVEVVTPETVDLEIVTSNPKKVVELEKVDQLPFPDLKNMTEREEFVDSYKDWRIWCKNELTEETFYRYDLPDGAAIVVKSYLSHPSWMIQESERTELYLLTPDYRYFADCKQNMIYVKNYLKDLKVKGFAGKKR